jgi:hypothetical protein
MGIGFPKTRQAAKVNPAGVCRHEEHSCVEVIPRCQASGHCNQNEAGSPVDDPTTRARMQLVHGIFVAGRAQRAARTGGAGVADFRITINSSKPMGLAPPVRPFVGNTGRLREE